MSTKAIQNTDTILFIAGVQFALACALLALGG
jgi:hypothetical protein